MIISRPTLGCAILGLLLIGCGVNNSPTFSNRVIGSEGQLFFLDELEEIANDPALSDLEKRDEFRDMGIGDEKIINALLQL